MKMDFSPNLVLKISALTLAIVGVASCTSVATGAESQPMSASSSTALPLGNSAMAGGTNDTVAIGSQANAGLNSATSVGGQANAAGLGSTSIGWQSKATAER
ncbi:hypothetical protein ACS8FD_17090, partial [Psychrobacter sp. 1U2]